MIFTPMADAEIYSPCGFEALFKNDNCQRTLWFTKLTLRLFPLK